MTDPKKLAQPDAIKEIIEAEEAGALARFRSSRFGERLHRTIADQARTRPRPAGVPSALRPVWVSLAALIILGAAAVWLLRPREQTIAGGPAIEAALHGLPGLEAIENPQNPLTGASLLPASPLETCITSVLSIPKRMGGAPAHGRGRGFSAINPRSKPLGIQRFYEILVIDRSVERVLADIAPKTKEG